MQFPMLNAVMNIYTASALRFVRNALCLMRGCVLFAAVMSNSGHLNRIAIAPI